MENLYQQTLRLLSETQRKVHDLSTFSSGNQEALEVHVWESIQQLEQDCYRLENMARKEPPSTRQTAKYRVEQLIADLKAVQGAHHSYQQRKSAAELEAQQREELMSRRFAPNSERDDTSISIDQSLHHHSQLQSANRGLDELIGNASGIMTSLKNQHFTLKGVKRKILDVANTLGLNNTVMRLIERRSAQDTWIFFGGLIVTVTLMVLAVMYLL